MKNPINHNLLIFHLSLVLFVTMVFICINKVSVRWKNTPKDFYITVLINDSLMRKNKDLFPLKLQVADSIFYIDTLINRDYNTKGFPGEIKFLLKTVNNVLIHEDSLMYEGAERVFYYIKNFQENTDSAKIDIMEVLSI